MSASGHITAWPSPWTVCLSPPTVPPYGYTMTHATSAECQTRSCSRWLVTVTQQDTPLGTNAAPDTAPEDKLPDREGLGHEGCTAAGGLLAHTASAERH